MHQGMHGGVARDEQRVLCSRCDNCSIR